MYPVTDISHRKCNQKIKAVHAVWNKKSSQWETGKDMRTQERSAFKSRSQGWTIISLDIRLFHYISSCQLLLMHGVYAALLERQSIRTHTYIKIGKPNKIWSSEALENKRPLLTFVLLPSPNLPSLQISTRLFHFSKKLWSIKWSYCEMVFFSGYIGPVVLVSFLWLSVKALVAVFIPSLKFSPFAFFSTPHFFPQKLIPPPQLCSKGFLAILIHFIVRLTDWSSLLSLGRARFQGRTYIWCGAPTHGPANNGTLPGPLPYERWSGWEGRLQPADLCQWSVDPPLILSLCHHPQL